MFGPVPALHRFVVWLLGMVVFAGLAAWISPALPLSTAVLAATGLALGTVAVLLFLHDFQHPGRARAPGARRPRT